MMIWKSEGSQPILIQKHNLRFYWRGYNPIHDLRTPSNENKSISTLIAKSSLPDLVTRKHLFRYAGGFASNRTRYILKYEKYTVGNVASKIYISIIIEVLSCSNPDNKCIYSELCRASFLCFHNWCTMFHNLMDRLDAHQVLDILESMSTR